VIFLTDMAGQHLLLQRVKKQLAAIQLELAEIHNFIEYCLPPMSDSVDHPPHYTAGKVEVIDVLEDWAQHAPTPVLGGLQWQVLKYLSRMWLKGNAYQDACKARWYLNRLINKIATEPYEK
jgi:hypothetical protein